MSTYRGPSDSVDNGETAASAADVAAILASALAAQTAAEAAEAAAALSETNAAASETAAGLSETAAAASEAAAALSESNAAASETAAGLSETNAAASETAAAASAAAALVSENAAAATLAAAFLIDGTRPMTANMDVGGFAITNLTTVDGRDVSVDGTKLDGIEAGATADQTGAEIKTAYEAEADTNAYTDAEKTKLTGIETGATADQTAAELLTAIKTVDGDTSGLDADLVKGVDNLHKFAIQVTIPVGSDATFTIAEYALFGCTIDKAYYKTDSGTITANVQIGGVSVTGLSALSLTSTQGNSTATAANTVSAGDRVTVVTTSNSSAVNASLILHCTRT